MGLTVSTLVLSLLFSIGILKLFLFTKKKLQLWSALRDIPGPSRAALPLFGHALFLGEGDAVAVYNRSKDIFFPHIDNFGCEIVRIWLGITPIIMVGGPNAAEIILHSTQHLEKSFFYDQLQCWLGTGLLTSTGEKWKVRRKLLTPTFHFSILQDFLEVMNEQALVFVQKIESYADSGETLDITEPVTLCALDIICETALGKSIKAQENTNSDYVKAIYKASEMIQARGNSPWLWSDFVFYLTPTGREFAKHLKVLHSTSQSIIRDRMKNVKDDETLDKKKRLAFLDLLIKTSDGGKVLSFSDIQEEVDTFMFEGHDTTSSAMTFAFHLIGAHPDVQHRIQEEMDDVFGDEYDQKLSMEDVRKLEYLELVIKESLRLFPAVPIYGRKTSADCVMDGHRIPAGTTCMLFPQVINQNKHFWPDPEKFDPERFTTENSTGRHPYAYLPFSAGPRNCIGQRFALLEEKVIFAQILRKYTIESCDRTEDVRFRLSGDLVLRPADGVNIKFTKRKI